MTTETVEAVPLEEITASDLIARIQRIRDDVTGMTMTRHGGRNRELSMAMARLDEARMWITEYGVSTAQLRTVDIKKLQADAMEISRIRAAAPGV